MGALGGKPDYSHMQAPLNSAQQNSVQQNFQKFDTQQGAIPYQVQPNG